MAPIEMTKARLLLAEDDHATRPIIGEMLRRANFDIDFADSGQEAVAMWEHGKYDLILMDVHMPNIDGIEATCIIKEKERTSGGHIPIIAVTAYSSHETKDKCIAAGMDACIHKPIDFRSALKVIEESLLRKQAPLGSSTPKRR